MGTLNREKLKALIHYIADAVPQALLGKLKLNKVLWFSDREMYMKTGTSITGETYLKYPEGPVSQHILGILAELEKEGKVVSRKSRVIDYDRIEYISMKDPDISMFSARELDIVGRNIAWITPLSSKEVSSRSHDRMWQIADDMGPIPLFSSLTLATRELESTDMAWALSGD